MVMAESNWQKSITHHLKLLVINNRDMKLTWLSSGETFQCNALLIACCRHQISTCSYYKKFAIFLHFCFKYELIMGLLKIQENQNTRADGGPISIRRLCRRLDIDLKSTNCHEINIAFTSNVVLIHLLQMLS